MITGYEQYWSMDGLATDEYHYLIIFNLAMLDKGYGSLVQNRLVSRQPCIVSAMMNIAGGLFDKKNTLPIHKQLLVC
jgi:hypothetical protein